VANEKIQIELQIQGLNWLISTNPALESDKLKALKLMKSTLNWAAGLSPLSPLEIAEVFIDESP
jgi:hypothetical protein